MSGLWKLLIKIVAVILMVAAIVILSVCLHKANMEKRRVQDNWEAAVSDRSRQQTIDVGELKEYFHEEVETLKKFGIRPRDIEHIVEVSYVYRDTTIYRDTLIYVYDTVREERTADFCVETKCFNVDGRIIGDTLEVYGINMADEILVALYKEKRKCIFDKRRVKAVAISACSGDTLAIIRNLKIER